MNHLKIGLRLESLGLPLRKALNEATRLGVTGAQFDAVGDLGPKTLSQSGRRDLRTLLRVHNLELAALGCPLRRGLATTEDQDARLAHVRDVMSLAFELGPRVVVLQAGQLPEKEDDPSARLLREALKNLSAHGDRIGVTLALETGLESGAALVTYLQSYDTGSLSANLDPGNLLLHGFDPVTAVRALAGRIAHTHARDCRRASASRAAREVPPGHGDIDWLSYLEALREVEYRGWLTVVRDEGTNRVTDVESGVAFLRRFVG